MVTEGMLAAKTTTMATKFKRRSIVDILFVVGIVLVVIGFAFLCIIADKPTVTWLPTMVIILGIVFLVTGLIVFICLLIKRPELLSPEDAQINAKVATLLTDNISEENKVEIAKVLMAPPTKQLGS